jgi:4-diphosphocytidyl-2-C-methyl-D-erythritol kinase
VSAGSPDPAPADRFDTGTRVTALTGLAAPAKLNLFLHVVGRRADGYHLLETVFTFIDFGDVIDLVLRPAGTLARSRAIPGVSAEQDLCLRAARLLAERSGCRQGVEISVDKRLPMGGGLGGGSSDAATVLVGLNVLWGLGWSRQALAVLALELGADVPVFVMGDSAFATGVGEELTPIPVPERWYVVLIPPVEVPTAGVFAAPELTRNTPRAKIADFSTGFGHNDLESVVCARYPLVQQALACLRHWGDARMTGSGSCVFAPFLTQAAAMACQAALPADWRGVVARGLQQHPLKCWP